VLGVVGRAKEKKVILELLTALLEYLDFDGFVQSAAVKASSLPQMPA